MFVCSVGTVSQRRNVTVPIAPVFDVFICKHALC